MAAISTSRELDFIIFGASGFTGKYTVKVASKLLSAYKWGIAGRNLTKLQQTASEIGDRVPIIIADTASPDSLRAMTQRCTILINCVGPYRNLGEPVLQACIATRTHQVDVAAESQYIKRMTLEYNEAAQHAGVFIVTGCGFGGIPSDMGVAYAESHFDGTLHSVEHYLTTTATKVRGPMMHHTTLVSILDDIVNWKELDALRGRLYQKQLPPQPVLRPKGWIHRKANKLWCFPFIAADDAIVRLSQNYFRVTANKHSVQFVSYFGTDSILELVQLILFGMLLGICMLFSCARSCVLKHPKTFTLGKVSHQGPSESEMANSTFEVTLLCKGWKSLKAPPQSPPKDDMTIQITGKDPYEFTGSALVLSALCLLEEKVQSSGDGGVFTPAAAFQNTNFIERLCGNAGVTFTC